MDEKKTIDQSELANDVASKIPYEFSDMFLVKLLDPIKVKKEFSKPVTNGAPKKDNNGIEAVDYDNVETEIKEVDSDFRKGVVIKVPYSYTKSVDTDDTKYSYIMRVKVGDIVLFRDQSGIFFDLLKDSKLLRQFDILAVEK